MGPKMVARAVQSWLSQTSHMDRHYALEKQLEKPDYSSAAFNGFEIL